MSFARSGVTGWPAVALGALAFYVNMLGATLPTPLYPAYAKQFGLTEFSTTLIYATYAIGVVVGLLVFGHWSDQVGRKPMLVTALLLSALSAVMFVLPGAVPWLYVGRALSGLSVGIFAGTGTATLVDLAPEGGQARASLIAASVNMGGLGSGTLLAGILTQYAPLPLRLCFLVDIGLVVIGLLAVLALRESVQRNEALALAPRGLRLPKEVRPVFVRAGVAGFAAFAVIGLFAGISPAFVTDVLGHHNAALVGLVAMVVFEASVVGQQITVPLPDDRAFLLGCGALIVGMVFVATSLLTTSLWALVAGALVAGIGHGMCFRSGLRTVTAAAPGELRGEVTSSLFVAFYVGISIPVIGEGALVGATGLVTAGAVFTALVAVLAVLALVLLARSMRGRPAAAA